MARVGPNSLTWIKLIAFWLKILKYTQTTCLNNEVDILSVIQLGSLGSLGLCKFNCSVR